MLRELFHAGTATQDRIVWLEESQIERKIDFTKRTSGFEKITAFLPISDEIAKDESQRESYLESRLPAFVRQAEDAWLVERLLAEGLPVVRSPRKPWKSWFPHDLGGLAPDAVLINAYDYYNFPLFHPPESRFDFRGRWRRWHRLKHQIEEHKLRVVPTLAVPRGTQIVGAFEQGATVWQLGELTTEISDQHQDYFRSKIYAARAEERLALTLYRPSAFRVIGKAA